jgi:hypothetical protein
MPIVTRLINRVNNPLSIPIIIEYWDRDGLVAASRTIVPVDVTADLHVCANILGLPLELTAFHSTRQALQTTLFPRLALPPGSYLRVLPDQLA